MKWVESGGWRMCRERVWKYIIAEEEQLFNLLDDPTESHNLIADPECQEHVKRMRLRLLQRQRNTR
jgi:arylsulfatase A-like enzyme